MCVIKSVNDIIPLKQKMFQGQLLHFQLQMQKF